MCQWIGSVYVEPFSFRYQAITWKNPESYWLTLKNNICHMFPYSKIHGANMGPTWVLSAPDWPHVDSRNLAVRVEHLFRPNELMAFNQFDLLISAICPYNRYLLGSIWVASTPVRDSTDDLLLLDTNTLHGSNTGVNGLTCWTGHSAGVSKETQVS